MGDLSGAFSRRINFQHRLVYEVLDVGNSGNSGDTLLGNSGDTCGNSGDTLLNSY